MSNLESLRLDVDAKRRRAFAQRDKTIRDMERGGVGMGAFQGGVPGWTGVGYASLAALWQPVVVLCMQSVSASSIFTSKHIQGRRPFAQDEITR